MSLSKKMIIMIVILLWIAFLLTTFIYLPFHKNNTMTSNASEKTSQERIIELKEQPYVGENKAKVQIIEFGDYQCPYCKKFEEDILPKLQKDYVANGKVKFYFVNDVVLGSDSTLAGNASELIYHQYPKYFWDFHKELYAVQGEEKTGWVTNKLLLKVAEKTVPNLDKNRFLDGLTNKTFNKYVSSDNKLAQSLGITGTPSLLINGKKVNNPFDYKELQKDIESAK